MASSLGCRDVEVRAEFDGCPGSVGLDDVGFLGGSFGIGLDALDCGTRVGGQGRGRDFGFRVAGEEGSVTPLLRPGLWTILTDRSNSSARSEPHAARSRRSRATALACSSVSLSGSAARR